MYMLSHVWLFSTLWTVACQTTLSMRFPRQEYWSGLSFSPLGDLLNPGSNPHLLHWQADSLPLEPRGKPWKCRFRAQERDVGSRVTVGDSSEIGEPFGNGGHDAEGVRRREYRPWGTWILRGSQRRGSLPERPRCVQRGRGKARHVRKGRSGMYGILVQVFSQTCCPWKKGQRAHGKWQKCPHQLILPLTSLPGHKHLPTFHF